MPILGLGKCAQISRSSICVVRARGEGVRSAGAPQSREVARLGARRGRSKPKKGVLTQQQTWEGEDPDRGKHLDWIGRPGRRGYGLGSLEGGHLEGMVSVRACCIKKKKAGGWNGHPGAARPRRREPWPTLG